MFQVPEVSSSLPSTPNPRRNNFNSTFFSASNPSTTPAGPPPGTSQSVYSTTPAGPPPSSSYGGSRYNTQGIPFPSNNNSSVRPPSSPPHSRSGNGMHADLYSDDDEFNAMDEDEDFRESGPAESQDKLQNTDDLVNIPELARSMATVTQELRESDAFIVNTEKFFEKMSNGIKSQRMSEGQLSVALSNAASDLLDMWGAEHKFKSVPDNLGPGESASPVAKSMFVVSLLVTLHHPPLNDWAGDAIRNLHKANRLKPVPEILLDWLDVAHDPFGGELDEVARFLPNPTAHERFWDVIFSSVLRGKIARVFEVLRLANFKYAATAVQDGYEEPGYQGRQLENITMVFNEAMKVVQACPAFRSNDWNVAGADWDIFRRVVGHALADLEKFAEGSSKDRDASTNDKLGSSVLRSSLKSVDLSFSQMSRKAESQVPWTIYENLKYFYGQLLGTPSEIVAASADWIEATIGLTVWWDGKDESDMNASKFMKSRKSFGTSQNKLQLEKSPCEVYKRKLSESLRHVRLNYQDFELQVNPASRVQVALACVFGDDLEGLLSILRGWSPVVSAGVVELAELGSWTGNLISDSSRLMGMFDSSDLMVLSYAQKAKARPLQNEVRIHYAKLLAQRQTFHTFNEEIDGWHIAMQVLSRLTDKEIANGQIGDLLDGLSITTKERAEKIAKVCSQMGLQTQTRKISERYADYIMDKSTHNYGDALVLYARANNTAKIKEILNLLISLSLIQSRSVPPSSELDKTFADLLTSPKQMLSKPNRLDREAGVLLATQLSGYATLRKFYDTRDQFLHTSKSQKSKHKPSPIDVELATREAKKQASTALVSAITSAADSIHGGLLDASIDSVMPIDALLVLLGEALVFVNQPKRILTSTQIFAIMKATEDLSLAPTSTTNLTTATFAAAVQNFHGNDAPLPSLQPTSSSLTTTSSSQFSLVNASASTSDLLTTSSHPSSTENSIVLVRAASSKAVDRLWDWRKGLSLHAQAGEVLKILRLGLAKELADIWAKAEEC